MVGEKNNEVGEKKKAIRENGISEDGKKQRKTTKIRQKMNATKKAKRQQRKNKNAEK